MEINYQHASDMFHNLAGEGQALAGYCVTLDLENYEVNPLDAKVRENIKERCADELNHVIGDLLDAIRLSGLKIAPDGLDEMLDELKTYKAAD